MKQQPLYIYIISVAIIWIAILLVAYFKNDHFDRLALLCAGFWIGMLAMYLAVHFYRWK